MLTFGFVDKSYLEKMIIYPPAKINLGLRVVRRRPDGYHDIETLFYPIGLTDLLEFIPLSALLTDELTITGLSVPGASSDNLVLKACRLLRQMHHFPYFSIHLHKRIPMGAGLGGGSSDAALLVQGINRLFHHPLTDLAIADLALQIGSDCPFFLLNRPAIGLGRGELLTDFPISLKGYRLYLFHPGIHVSTQEAYARIVIPSHPVPLAEILQKDPSQWKQELVNDFEAAVFPIYPAIRELKEQLYSYGATYAAMSGSGSAVYGLFTDKPSFAPEVKRMMVWQGEL